jgi:hypothetical protein
MTIAVTVTICGRSYHDSASIKRSRFGNWQDDAGGVKNAMRVISEADSASDIDLGVAGSCYQGAGHKQECKY